MTNQNQKTIVGLVALSLLVVIGVLYMTGGLDIRLLSHDPVFGALIIVAIVAIVVIFRGSKFRNGPKVRRISK